MSSDFDRSSAVALAWAAGTVYRYGADLSQVVAKVLKAAENERSRDPRRSDQGAPLPDRLEAAVRTTLAEMKSLTSKANVEAGLVSDSSAGVMIGASLLAQALNTSVAIYGQPGVGLLARAPGGIGLKRELDEHLADARARRQGQPLARLWSRLPDGPVLLDSYGSMYQSLIVHAERLSPGTAAAETLAINNMAKWRDKGFEGVSLKDITSLTSDTPGLSVEMRPTRERVLRTVGIHRSPVVPPPFQVAASLGHGLNGSRS